MPLVTFIRHGESVANLGGYTDDFASIPLTERGMEQAAAVAAHWDAAPDLIVVSPFMRTRQTAQPTIDRFPQVPVEFWPVQEFAHVAASVWQGTVHESRGAAMEAWWQRMDPELRDGEGAETFTEFMQRIADVVERLRRLPQKRVLLFTHGYFLQGLRLHLMDAAKSNDETIAQFRLFDAEYPVRNCVMVTIELNEANVGLVPENLLVAEYA
jgi:broad specificity phosphatase PhoE